MTSITPSRTLKVKCPVCKTLTTGTIDPDEAPPHVKAFAADHPYPGVDSGLYECIGSGEFAPIVARSK